MKPAAARRSPLPPLLRLALCLAALPAALFPLAAQEEYQGMGLHGSERSLADDLDPFEPDGEPGAEAEVPGGQGRFERYLGPADIDRFRFYSAGLTAIEVLTDLDAQLLLFREGERVPLEVRGNPDRRAIRLEVRLAPGYYIAEVLAFDAEQQGAYTILFAQVSAPDPFEPDDAPAEARPLAPGARQERTLAEGDPDWVELLPGQPGFYTLYTTGLMTDTSLALFRDGRVQLMADDNSGAQANACLGFFLGPGRWLARVEGRPPLAGGPYTLAFEHLTPELLLPEGRVREYSLRDAPLFLQLRILRAGRYVLRRQGSRGPVEMELYSLPALRAQDPGQLLAAGDFLLVLKGEEGQAVKLCAASEAEARSCPERL